MGLLRWRQRCFIVNIYAQHQHHYRNFGLRRTFSNSTPCLHRNNPEQWATNDVVQWLGAHGFAKYAQNFAAERITGPLLVHDVDLDVLIELGVDDPATQTSMLRAISTLATAAGEDVSVVNECGAAAPLAFDADSSAAEEGNIPSTPLPSQTAALPGKSNPPAAAYAPTSTPPIPPPFPHEAPSHGDKSQHVASAQLDASGSGGAKGFVKTPRSRSKDRLSPSAAQRWMTCPPSHRYEQKFPEQPSSTYAEEGSFAHSLAELELNHQLGNIDSNEYAAEAAAHKENQWYSADLQGHVDGYVQYALQTVADARSSSVRPITVKVEGSVSVVGWAPPGAVKGTADLLVATDSEVHIIDFKYGRGIQVKSENNPQLMLYGLGALGMYGGGSGYTGDRAGAVGGGDGGRQQVQTVRMSVFQPRVFDEAQTIAMPAAELLHWAEHVLYPATSLALAGKGDFSAGDHCRFCRAKAVCRARANENMSTPRIGPMGTLVKPNSLDDVEISRILANGPALKKWVDDVTEHALATSKATGKRWPGFSLKPSRSRRKYADPSAAAMYLKALGVNDDQIYKTTTKIRPLTEIERTNSQAFALLEQNQLVIKVQGSPKLVQEETEAEPFSSK